MSHIVGASSPLGQPKLTGEYCAAGPEGVRCDFLPRSAKLLLDSADNGATPLACGMT